MFSSNKELTTFSEIMHNIILAYTNNWPDIFGL